MLPEKRKKGDKEWDMLTWNKKNKEWLYRDHSQNHKHTEDGPNVLFVKTY